VFLQKRDLRQKALIKIALKGGKKAQKPIKNMKKASKTRAFRLAHLNIFGG